MHVGRQVGRQGKAHLGTDLHGLAERRGSRGQDHELLEGQPVSGVLATVDDVESRHGHLELVVTRQVGEVLNWV